MAQGGDFDGDGSINLMDFRKMVDLELSMTQHHNRMSTVVR
jgi:hypothetical protein